jgi:hypothetical protein
VKLRCNAGHRKSGVHSWTRPGEVWHISCS